MKKDNSDFYVSDRVKLSDYFDVYAHGKGFQLKKDDETYSIVPVKLQSEGFLHQSIGWEVDECGNNFHELHEAIEYVLNLEGITVEVYNLKEFYDIEVGDMDGR